MNTNRRRAVAALAAAGLLWGTTVPLSKLALQWLQPGWLTAARFGLAAAILLAVAARSPGSRARVRAACTPLMLVSGAIGYGGSVVLQNAGITRTSVTHAALLIGTTPVLVAVIAALWRRAVARPVAWAGFGLSLAGVVLVAGGGGGGASAAGDGLVMLSLLLGAAFTVAQGRLLHGQDPVAVTAVQFVGATLAALPFSAATEGLPAAPHSMGVVVVTVALAAGTLLPFTLFAFGQSRVSAEIAGAFLNIEPLVGAVAGVVVFGDPFGAAQAAGAAAIIGGITLSMLPLLRPARRQPREPAPAPATATAAGVMCPAPVIPEPARAMAEPASAIAEPGQAIAEPGGVIPEPARVAAEPARAMAEPGRVMAEPGRVMAEPGRRRDGYRPAPGRRLVVVDPDPRRRPAGRRVRSRPGVPLAAEQEDRQPLSISWL